ncbi:hypothetical protein [Nocardia aurea]|jgi:hypothetical protein|uniref:Uncharacterized protein n=1 Tax=Nocardia aurea TaxID=2144174 RepID=A0ABV3FUX6_9NOCA
MRTEETWEIPPLDDAPDIARPRVTGTGAALADPRHWPGIGVAVTGLAFAVLAAVFLTAGYPGLAIVGAVIAGAALIGGAVLLVLERRRRTDQGEAGIVPRLGLGGTQ